MSTCCRKYLALSICRAPTLILQSTQTGGTVPNERPKLRKCQIRMGHCEIQKGSPCVKGAQHPDIAKLCSQPIVAAVTGLFLLSAATGVAIASLL
jgi:hypothetical protein